MRLTKDLTILAIIIGILFAALSIAGYILKIITFKEFFVYFVFCACGTIALLILKNEDVIGHILKGEKFKIGKKKILPVAIITLIIGATVLFDGLLISKDETYAQKMIPIIFGSSCIIMGLFAIICWFKNRIENKK